MDLIIDPALKQLMFGLVKEKLPFMNNFEKTEYIAFSNNDKISSICLYNNYLPKRNMEMTIVSFDKNWCTKSVLETYFKYPFSHIDINRVSATIKKHNKIARRFVEKLGFRLEGTIRELYEDDDACIYGLLKKDNKWS